MNATLWILLIVVLVAAGCAGQTANQGARQQYYTAQDVDKLISALRADVNHVRADVADVNAALQERENASTQPAVDALSRARYVDAYDQSQSPLAGPFLAMNRTANEYCREHNFGTCILVLNEHDAIYFTSTNGTCSGNITSHDRSVNIDFPADCMTTFTDGFFQEGSGACLAAGTEHSDSKTTLRVHFICTHP